MDLVCPTCSGSMNYLGTLGMLLWFRCIDCGTETGLRESEVKELAEEGDAP